MKTYSLIWIVIILYVNVVSFSLTSTPFILLVDDRKGERSMHGRLEEEGY